MYLQLKVDATSINELKSIIKETIKSVVQDLTPRGVMGNTSSVDADKLLTRNEVMKMLKISHSTLYHYQRKDILPFIKIGSRVYFKKSDIVDNINLEGDPNSYKLDDED